MIDIRTPKEKNKFFSFKRFKAKLKNPLNCTNCGACISACKHKAIVFGKKSLILICFIMATVNLFPNQIAQDTLSMDEAIRIGMKNNQRKETASRANYETELITSIISKYNNLLFQQECYKSIEKTKLHLTNELGKEKIKPRRRDEYNLHIQSIVIDLDVMLLMQYQKVLESKRLLNEILGVSKTCDFFLLTSFDNVYTNLNPVLDNKRKKVSGEIITSYNNQVSLLQKLSIRKQLSKYQLNNTLKYFNFNFTELKIEVENHISIQIKYLTQLLELKEKYNTPLNLLVL